MIDDYFERPYWIVDILPFQVPADSPGQYFAVEEYYLQKPRWQTLRRKYLEILLKLNCYFDLQVTTDPGRDRDPGGDADSGGDGDPAGNIDPDAWPRCGWQKNPAPETLEKLIMEGPEKNPEEGLEEVPAYFTVYVLFEAEDTLAVLNSDDNYMTVYDPPERLRELLQVLAGAEGLFMWQPPE